MTPSSIAAQSRSPVPASDAAQAERSEGPKLSFYDHDRQSYGHLPIKSAAEFMVGDYDDDGGAGGEFKIALIELGDRDRRRRLAPQLQAFGDAADSLRAAIALGLLGALDWCDTADEFAERLIALGIPDRSEFPIGSPSARCHCCGQPNARRTRFGAEASR